MTNWLTNHKKNLILHNSTSGWRNLGWPGEGAKSRVSNLESTLKYLYDNKRIGNFEDDLENSSTPKINDQ